MLENPSFESWYHMDNIQELQIPTGWNFWWADETVPNLIDTSPGAKFVRPEMRVLSRGDLPEHEQALFIKDGEHTLKIFKDSGSWLGGLSSQGLDLKAGMYRFTPQVYGDLIKGYDEDDNKVWGDDSEGRDGLVRYGLKTDLDSQAWESIVPGKWNIFAFEFYADGSTTIGVDFMCPFPLRNSGVFCDAWKLERIGDEPAPERQYARVVHLLPQKATEAEIAQVVEIATPSKESFSWSVDDAFVTAPALKARTVHVWDVERVADDPATLEAWVERFYPPLPKIVYHSFEPISDWQRYLLWQLEPRWRDKYFGSVGYRTTIGKEGCYITIAASAMRFFGLDADATPVSVDAALGTEGYKPGTAEALWSAIKAKLGISIRSGTEPDVVDALNRGDLVMAEVLPKSLQHFVLVVENLGDGDYLMLDPYENVIAPVRDHYDGVESWRILSPVEAPPPPPPPPPKPLKERLTLHLQTLVPDWLEFVKEVQPAGLKLVGGIEAARDVKAVSPGTDVLYRHHLSAGDQQKYLDRLHYLDENGKDKWWDAGHFLDRFWDAIVANATWIHAVEGLNETIASGDMPGIEKAVKFEVAFAEELARRCKKVDIDVRACLLNVAVGNPQHGYETEKLIPAAIAAVRYRGYLGYHGYFPAHVDHAERWLEEEGRHHHLRAEKSWKPTFAKYGLNPPLLCTEVGAVGMDARPDGRPGGYDSEAGWRAALDGDLPRYIRLLIRFSEMSNAIALMIFTEGGGKRWKSFEMGKELGALASAIRGG